MQQVRDVPVANPLPAMETEVTPGTVWTFSLIRRCSAAISGCG
jgi:hypothetical protein